MSGQSRLVSPRRFMGWQPGDVDNYSHDNKQWVDDINYGILAKVFANSLVDGACSALNVPKPSITQVDSFRTVSKSRSSEQKYAVVGNTGLHLSGNIGNVQSFDIVNGKRVGKYTSKRYVRLSPVGYHPNGIQMYVEAYMSGATKDVGGRDPSDDMYGDYGFPVAENCMGLFVGVSTIMYPPNWNPNKIDEHDNLMAWAMKYSEYTLEALEEDFRDMRSLLDEVGEDLLGLGIPPVFLRNQRIQRLRFRLPDQPLDADDWSASGLEEACSKLAAHFAPMMDDIGKR